MIEDVILETRRTGPWKISTAGPHSSLSPASLIAAAVSAHDAIDTDLAESLTGIAKAGWVKSLARAGVVCDIVSQDEMSRRQAAGEAKSVRIVTPRLTWDAKDTRPMTTEPFDGALWPAAIRVPFEMTPISFYNRYGRAGFAAALTEMIDSLADEIAVGRDRARKAFLAANPDHEYKEKIVVSAPAAVVKTEGYVLSVFLYALCYGQVGLRAPAGVSL